MVKQELKQESSKKQVTVTYVYKLKQLVYWYGPKDISLTAVSKFCNQVIIKLPSKETFDWNQNILNNLQKFQLMKFGFSFSIKVSFIKHLDNNICSRLKEKHKKQRPRKTSARNACLKL